MCESTDVMNTRMTEKPISLQALLQLLCDGSESAPQCLRSYHISLSSIILCYAIHVEYATIKPHMCGGEQIKMFLLQSLRLDFCTRLAA